MAEYMEIIRNPKHNNFKNLYRFDEQNVRWVADHFLPDMAETRGGELSHIHQMKIFLRYVGDHGFQRGIGEELGVEQSTVCRTVNYVREKIMSKAKTWIKFPNSCNDIYEAKQLWQTKYKFPMAIGVIDCTHVRIQKPDIHGDEYINREGVATINVQATCNGEEIFTSVDVSWPGSVRDSKIWKNSEVRQTMKRAKDAVLLGDDDYDGLEPWLMTPHRNPLTQKERLFNSLFKKERIIIERCFGQLKRRFPVLQYVRRTQLESIPSLIMCCFVLHNVAKHLGDEDEDCDESPSEDMNDNSDTTDDSEDEEDILQEGRSVRENIARVICNQNLQ